MHIVCWGTLRYRVPSERTGAELIESRRDHQRHRNRVHPAQRRFPLQPLEDHGHEFERQDGAVERYAPGHFEHDRVRIPQHQRVPDPVRPPQVEQQRHHHQHITEECRKNRRPEDRLKRSTLKM